MKPRSTSAPVVERQQEAVVINLQNIPRALHSMFKAACAARDITMRDAFLAFMESVAHSENETILVKLAYADSGDSNGERD